MSKEIQNRMVQGKILIAILCFTMTSCSLNRVYMNMFERQMLWQLNHAGYVRNAATGLCYMVTDGYQSVQFECVPCDSLKNVQVLTIKPRP